MVRKRIESYENMLYRHSPLKRGIVKVKDEDDTFKPYNEIIKHLWVGNHKTAKNKEFFKKHNIAAVINCTKDLPNSFSDDKKIQYLRIPVDDSLKEVDYQKMYNYFPVIIEFLNKVINIEKKNVLINCVMGRQRSVIAASIFLVWSGMNPEDALKYILQKRPEAFHFGLSFNFKKSFIKYSKFLEKCIKCKLPSFR